MDADSSDAVTRTPEPSNAVLEPPNVSPSKGRSLGKSCLKLFPRRGPTKKAVIFNLEKNRTKIIEARSAVEMNPDPVPLPAVAPSPLPGSLPLSLPLSLPHPPVLHSTCPQNERRLRNAGQQLISDMKMRILKWNYQWISVRS